MKLNRWVVSLNENIMCIYLSGRNLVYRQYGTNWSDEIVIAHGIVGNISVSICHEKKLYVFCQDIRGNIVLCHFNGKKWSDSILRHNKSGMSIDIYFYAAVYERGMSLLYNIPNESHHILVLQHKLDGAGWTEPVKIDTLEGFAGVPFVVQKVSGNHHVIYYNAKSANTLIGYREIAFDQKRWGKFHTIFKSSYKCVDATFLTTTENIHALLSMQGKYSGQLIYTKKEGSEFAKPYVVYEAPRIEESVMNIQDGDLRIVFRSGGSVYTTYKQGNEFSRIVRNRHSDMAKTVYITDKTQDTQRLALNFIYTEKNDATKFLFIPELTDYAYIQKSICENEQIEVLPTEPVYNEQKHFDSGFKGFEGYDGFKGFEGHDTGFSKGIDNGIGFEFSYDIEDASDPFFGASVKQPAVKQKVNTKAENSFPKMESDLLSKQLADVAIQLQSKERQILKTEIKWKNKCDALEAEKKRLERIIASYSENNSKVIETTVPQKLKKEAEQEKVEQIEVKQIETAQIEAEQEKVEQIEVKQIETTQIEVEQIETVQAETEQEQQVEIEQVQQDEAQLEIEQKQQEAEQETPQESEQIEITE